MKFISSKNIDILSVYGKSVKVGTYNARYGHMVFGS